LNQRFLEGKAVVQITAIVITIDHLLVICIMPPDPPRLNIM
jgi:hypothetical protein